LALGGGGVRGLSHLGVLKVLEEEGIRIDLIAGVSMGAIIGGGYALNPDIKSLTSALLEALDKIDISKIEGVSYGEFFRKKDSVYKKLSAFVREIYALGKQRLQGFIIDSSLIEEAIKGWVDEKEFKETKIPFYAVCTDLNTGEEIVVHEGRLDKAILASAAIPAVFPPIEIKGRVLTDGGVLESVPVKVLRREGADIVIAVNLHPGLKRRDFSKGMEILYQISDIRAKVLNDIQLTSADIVIEPPLKEIGWAHFSQARRCIKAGEEETRRRVEEIKVLLRRKKGWLVRLFSKG